MEKYTEYNIKLFIEDAMDLYNKGHYVTSFSLVCCAIDACAKIKYSKKPNNICIKLWINDHINAISRKGLPVTLGKGCKFKFGNIPNLRKDDNGYSGIEDVIYSLIRCSLVHECKLSSNVILGNEDIFSYNNDMITIPHKIIVGLIEAILEDFVGKHP